jgi:hypothetical protein
MSNEDKLAAVNAAIEKWGKLTRLPKQDLGELYRLVTGEKYLPNCGACHNTYVQRLLKFKRANEG